MIIGIKIGGHIFASHTDSKIKAYAELLTKLQAAGHRIVAVMGGGDEARKYILAARKLGGSELVCDVLGIEVARLNARLLITALGDQAYPEPPTSIEELRKAFEVGKIVVMGGLQPGHSTNAVGILAAEAVGAALHGSRLPAGAGVGATQVRVGV